MAHDGYVQVPADSSGKKVDAASLTVGSDVVIRQRMIIADNSHSATFARVTTAGGLLVELESTRISGTVSVVGTLSLGAGTANIGTINNISATVSVAGTFNLSGTALVAGTVSLAAGGVVNVSNTHSVILAAGSANIGTVVVNGISATVTVAGNVAISGTATVIMQTAMPPVAISGTPSVILAGGTANFGHLNHISRTVEVSVSTPFTVNGVSATVTVTTSNPWIVAQQSSSHGPVQVRRSVSTTFDLVVAPGAGHFVYVTMIAATNAGTVATVVKAGPSVSTSCVAAFCNSGGGQFVFHFDPPWKLPGNEALKARIDPGGTDVRFICNFFVRNA